jgi:catechol 2,3-dioxygenase-like lactoylglutathione lyase family enzyme
MLRLHADAAAVWLHEGIASNRQCGDDPRARFRRPGHPGGVIYGAHVILYSGDPDADRAFLADVLGFEHVDAGGGWLIFGLPPAEVAVHPAEAPSAELYLMCDELTAEMQRLEARGVRCSAVEEARWGSVTKIGLPGGGEVGLYQPRHPAMVEPR